jgi:hypothetical protein
MRSKEFADVAFAAVRASREVEMRLETARESTAAFKDANEQTSRAPAAQRSVLSWQPKSRKRSWRHSIWTAHGNADKAAGSVL